MPPHRAFSSASWCFRTLKSTVIWCSCHIRFWLLMRRSEQLPTRYPRPLARRTMFMVMLPGGSPTSNVPSMSKLMSLANYGPRVLHGLQQDVGGFMVQTSPARLQAPLAVLPRQSDLAASPTSTYLQFVSDPAQFAPVCLQTRTALLSGSSFLS